MLQVCVFLLHCLVKSQSDFLVAHFGAGPELSDLKIYFLEGDVMYEGACLSGLGSKE